MKQISFRKAENISNCVAIVSLKGLEAIYSSIGLSCQSCITDLFIQSFAELFIYTSVDLSMYGCIYSIMNSIIHLFLFSVYLFIQITFITISHWCVHMYYILT